MELETQAQTQDQPQPQQVVVLDDRTRKTYRYLRVAVVALALLLMVSLLIEIATNDWSPAFGSISGFYYTPVRSVFVGALVAVGPVLIAIKGRAGWEDSLLDVAGALVPVVALVPTPILPVAGVYSCEVADRKCVPEELVHGVVNNVSALLVVGAAGVVFAWWQSRGSDEVSARRGLLVAAVLWLITAVFLWVPALQGFFLKSAHYSAAITFFVLLAGVAWVNGQRVAARPSISDAASARFRGAYRGIATAMVLAALLTGVAFLLTWWARVAMPFMTIFVIEAVLLLLFVAFWTLQTVENWDIEASEDDPTAA